MSATVPDIAPTAAPSAAAARLSFRRLFVELHRTGLFLRLGRVEVWAGPDLLRQSAWFVRREPGSVEVAAGRFRLIVSWAPVGARAAGA